ncbi:MAG: hypothetical protein ACREN8_13290 [Candidatus Dormibacteraceae bacterium]
MGVDAMQKLSASPGRSPRSSIDGEFVRSASISSAYVYAMEFRIRSDKGDSVSYAALGALDRRSAEIAEAMLGMNWQSSSPGKKADPNLVPPPLVQAYRAFNSKVKEVLTAHKGSTIQSEYDVDLVKILGDIGLKAERKASQKGTPNETSEGVSITALSGNYLLDKAVISALSPLIQDVNFDVMDPKEQPEEWSIKHITGLSIRSGRSGVSRKLQGFSLSRPPSADTTAPPSQRAISRETDTGPHL